MWFPAVGSFIGMVLALVFYPLAVWGLPCEAIVAVILLVSVVITGGLHLDGLSDCADGFYAARTKEDVLRIMDDSHIGAMGTIAVCCVLILKYALLVSLLKLASMELVVATLIVVSTVSRWGHVMSCAILPPAKKEGLGCRFAVGLRSVHWIGAAVLACLVAVVFLEIVGLILLMVGLAIVLVAAVYVRQRIGGLTGDTLGATSEIVEVATLFAALTPLLVSEH